MLDNAWLWSWFLAFTLSWVLLNQFFAHIFEHLHQALSAWWVSTHNFFCITIMYIFDFHKESYNIYFTLLVKRLVFLTIGHRKEVGVWLSTLCIIGMLLFMFSVYLFIRYWRNLYLMLIFENYLKTCRKSWSQACYINAPYFSLQVLCFLSKLLQIQDAHFAWVAQGGWR